MSTHDENSHPLSETDVLLARIDERYKSLELRHVYVLDRLHQLERTVDKLGDAVQENTQVTQTISKLFWIIVVAASTALVAQFFAFV